MQRLGGLNGGDWPAREGREVMVVVIVIVDDIVVVVIVVDDVVIVIVIVVAVVAVVAVVVAVVVVASLIPSFEPTWLSSPKIAHIFLLSVTGVQAFVQPLVVVVMVVFVVAVSPTDRLDAVAVGLFCRCSQSTCRCNQRGHIHCTIPHHSYYQHHQHRYPKHCYFQYQHHNCHQHPHFQHHYYW